MKRYFAYIRVSTSKQGELGSSLQEQRSAIEAYARKHDLTISRWYEERETAAKSGRLVFGSMLRDLEVDHAAGIVIHKIDRSARNLKDWAAVGDLIDRGIEVHFAHESLDLNSRGGRLAADVQAVVAADYIRNLRDEVKKGFYGRLKQGLLPLPAPVGYLDQGKGKPKIIDPARGPLVRDAFLLYASGEHSVRSLRLELIRRGLRTTRGATLSRSGVADLLRNPFYIGLIRIKKTGEFFNGVHEPLVGRELFARVQQTLDSKWNRKLIRHRFLFQRMIRCGKCKLALVGERQKGHVYYRCHSYGCEGTSTREERFEDAVCEYLRLIQFRGEDFGDLRDAFEDQKRSAVEDAASRRMNVDAAIAACEQRLIRLTDAFLDGSLDRETYQTRKNALVRDKQAHLNALSSDGTSGANEHVVKYLELAKSALLSYERGNLFERRALIKTTTSNLLLDEKKPVIALRSPFQAIAKFNVDRSGGPPQIKPRTEMAKLLDELRVCADRGDVVELETVKLAA